MEDRVFLGVDVGGTKISAALVDKEGFIVEEVKEATCCEDFSSFLLLLYKAVSELLELSANRKYAVGGIGLAIAGLVDFKEQTVLFAPNLPLREVPLKSMLEEKFETTVFVDNDANCAAWAEKLFGAGRDEENFICVTLGTGVGGGIVANGKLYRGALGCAGEIGHMVLDVNGPRCGCGRFGCFEALASAQALVKRAMSEVPPESLLLELVGGKKERISGVTITEAAKKGDVFAQALLADIGRIIGIGFVNLINIFNPAIIVVGGGLAAASEFILQAAQEEILSQATVTELLQTKIVLAQLGQKAGVIGAAMLARGELSS